jgi:hypothetical protein
MELDPATVAVVVPRGTDPAKWYEEKLGFEIGGEAEGHWVVVAPKGSRGEPKDLGGASICANLMNWSPATQVFSSSQTT